MNNNISLFDGLTEEEEQQLLNHATSHEYKKGTIIFNEGDDSDSLYIIKSGRVKVFLHGENGKEIVLNVHGVNEFFGEMALIDEDPRSASVVTTEPTKVLILKRHDFESYLEKYPHIAINLIKVLVNRMRLLTMITGNLALLDVYGRIVRILISMAKTRIDGTSIVTERLTHQDIANRVGASREMVSRILKDMSMGGYIRFDNKQIIILKHLPSAW